LLTVCSITCLLSAEPAPQASGDRPGVTILERGEGILVVRVDFPTTFTRRDAAGSAVRMGRLPMLPDPDGQLLPDYRLILPGWAEGISVRILDAQTDRIRLDAPPRSFTGDRPLGLSGETLVAGSSNQRRLANRSWAEILPLGEYRRIPLSILHLQPARWDARRSELTVLTSLELRLDFPSRPGKGERRVLLPEALGNLADLLPLPAFTTNPPVSPQVSNSTGEMRLKLFVSEEGIHHLSSTELAAWGANLSSEDPRTIRLEHRGEEHPIYIHGEADGRFDEEDYIEFWGEGLHGTYIDQNPEIYSDLYTDVNVYWLSWGGDLGARLVEESGEVIEVNELNMFRATSFPSTVHSEENFYYNRLSQVDPDSLKEHWYYDNGVSASETQNYSVYLPYPDDNALINVRVRVSLHGLTYPDAYGQGGQHHAYVSLEDQNSPALEAGSSGASWWIGQTGVILDAQGSQGIDPAVLTHGNNQLSIFVPVDTDAGPNDTILLNWFKIIYQRLYKADSDLIRFAPPDAAQDTLVDFRIDGFSSPQISLYKLGQSKVINAEITPYQQGSQTLYQLHFQDRPYGDRDYVALTPAARMQPDSARLVEGADILSQLSVGEPVKLLTIASRIFESHPGLEAFIDRRADLLGRTELVFIDDVFDECSFGIYSPQAVKDLLLALPVPPEILLLIGDGSYDTRNVYGYGGNLIPIHYVQTEAYGAVPSDFWYGLLDNDLIPELAVGRIPARDSQELDDYLGKIEEYETSPVSGAWRNRHLFVTGTGGVPGTAFLELSQQVIERLQDNVFVERLATDPVTNPFYGGTSDLIDLFNAGALAVDYNGHGAGAIWSDNSLFRIENLPQLGNQGKYPFITNFTCFIGAFDTPQQGSILGEEFIFEPQKGAIGVLASTGLGWFINGGWLQEELVGLMYDNTDLSLGELINAAKILYYAYYGQGGSTESFDTMHLMNLLGDPSLRLAYADAAEGAPQVSPQFVSTGESVSIDLSGDFSGFEGSLRVYDENDYPALQFGSPYEVPLTASASALSATFDLPALGDSTTLNGGTYRLNFWDPTGTQAYNAAASFYYYDAYADSSIVDSLAPNPDPVYAQDTFGFRAKILDPEAVDTAWVHFSIETESDSLIAEGDFGLSEALESNWYQTDLAIDSTTYGYGVSDRVEALVWVVDSASDTTISEEISFYILDGRADPEWISGSLEMGMRDDQAALIIQIENLGHTDVDSMDVEFYLDGTSLQLIGSAVVYNLAAGEAGEVWSASTLQQPGDYPLEVRMNEAGWVDVVDPLDPYQGSLNVDHFNVTTAAGTSDTLSIEDYFQAYIPPGSISGDQGVLIFRSRDDLTLSVMQSGISFILQDSTGYLQGFGFEIGLLGDIALNGDSLKLFVDYQPPFDTLMTADELALHLQIPGQSGWQLLTSETETLSPPPQPHYRISAGSQWPGVYTQLANSDHQNPAIEITVEGQIYTDGGYVPNQPKISALVQDFGGVDNSAGSYWISVDGEVVDSSLISLNYGDSGQTLTLSINPTFTVGNHTVSVSARDLSGNLGSTSIQFQVVGEFRLDFVGNYPNPFKKKTYFAYRLTEQTTEPVRIQIYTVSGRMIRTLYSSSSEEINYAEIYWDGRDEDGAMIANGVYFYKLTARRGDHEIERTMKMAKLR
jgi:hypothetical protein